MADITLQYIAGFIDGEASIHSTKSGAPVIAIYQLTKNCSVLEEIRIFLKQLGIDSSLNHSKPRMTNLRGPQVKTSSMSVLQIRSIDSCVRFLEIIIPEFRVKKTKAIEVLNLAKSKKFRTPEAQKIKLHKAMEQYLDGATLVSAAKNNNVAWFTLKAFLMQNRIHVRTNSESKKHFWKSMSSQERAKFVLLQHPPTSR